MTIKVISQRLRMDKGEKMIDCKHCTSNGEKLPNNHNGV